jgi:hypothetical protein
VHSLSGRLDDKLGGRQHFMLANGIEKPCLCDHFPADIWHCMRRDNDIRIACLVNDLRKQQHCVDRCNPQTYDLQLCNIQNRVNQLPVTHRMHSHMCWKSVPIPRKSLQVYRAKMPVPSWTNPRTAWYGFRTRTAWQQ